MERIWNCRSSFARSLLLMFGAALGGWGLTGCSGYAAPRIAVTQASVSAVSAEAAALRFELELENPNREPLELVAFNYHLDVNGRRAYSGTWAAQATLTGDSTRRLTVPAVIPFDQPGQPEAPLAYTLRGSVEYLTPGKIAEIFFDSGVRRPKAAFRGEGEIEVAAAPPAE